MKIQFASDLHLEFPENKRFIKLNPIKPIGDILLLAGDIIPLITIDQHKDFFNYLSDHFKETFWIPGNHEYYHYDISKKADNFKENIRNNVILANNVCVEYNDFRLILSTLWSKINPDKQWYIEKSMNDFQLIKYKSFRFSLDRFNEQHETCLAFLKSELKKDFIGKSVVITHHVPTLINYPEQYKTSDLNEAFAVELIDFIYDYQPDYWIYGHHHSNIPDFEIGKTKLLTNQLGYVSHSENKDFKTDRIFEI